jgi:glycerol-3-phosphate acyltransferase PlsY
MHSWTTCILLIVTSYLFGSIPVSYLIARSRGVDLRKQGSQQVGGGNLWRTTSHKLGAVIAIYDLLKGPLFILAGWWAGLDAGQQLLVALAMIIGHNWPVFLRFHGGRGIAIALGTITVIPFINWGNISIWPTAAFFIVAVGIVIFMHRTPVPVLFGFIAAPIVSAIVKDPWLVSLSYAGMVLIIIIKRLVAQPSTEKWQTGLARVLFNRFLLDRDISDRNAWVHRNSTVKKE